jgi:hypothetical protein
LATGSGQKQICLPADENDGENIFQHPAKIFMRSL